MSGGDGSIEEKRESSRRAFSPASARAGSFASMASALANSIHWRQQLARRLGGELGRVCRRILPRRCGCGAAVGAGRPGGQRDTLAAGTTDTSVPMLAAPRAEGLIEIVLPGGASARVDAQVDGRALRRCLARWMGDDHAAARCAGVSRLWLHR